MNISHVFLIFAISMMCQMGVVVADRPEVSASGKPVVQVANRDLGGWSTLTSKSSKHSKSTDQPTLFPTLNPTLFPTMAPTYCGKSSKSSWHSSSRRLGDWSSTSKSSKSCWSGSRGSSWRSGHSRRSRDSGRIRDRSHHNWPGNHKKKGNGRDLEQGKEDGQDQVEIKLDETNIRRRINGGRHAHLADPDA